MGTKAFQRDLLGKTEGCIEWPCGVRGMAQPGSAEVLGTSGRRFESCCPDHPPSLTLRRGKPEIVPVWRFADWNDGRPETELNFKLYRQATNKIVGISDEAASFLNGFL